MKGNQGKSHCSVRTMPVPAFVTCMRCGYEVELWSDEQETLCPACGVMVFRGEATVH